MSTAASRRQVFLLIVSLLAIIASDQLSKYLARALITPAGFSFFDGLIRLSLVQNHGGFLGIVADLPDFFRQAFLIGGVGALLGGCLYALFRIRERPSPYHLPLASITGGGLSNLLDRLHGDGGVTDFLILGQGAVQTGIFNLADVFVLVGAFVLGFRLFRGSGENSDRPRSW